VNGVWEMGSCNMLSRKYSALRTPFCSISNVFVSVSTWRLMLVSKFVCDFNL
jgi:hypothetical protein